VAVDFNEGSLLTEREHRDGNGCRYRVSDYDPRETESCHRFGQHRYHISREILDADVILSVPTLKTHEKVGITCCIKGLVGTVASKSCLAHHRFGGPEDGGDEYPVSSRLRRWESRYHDWLNRLEPNSSAWRWHSTIDRGLRFGLRRLGLIQVGGWQGNDTCWRMAADLAHIAHYADRNGILQQTPQRRHFGFIDGIVGGEKDGPLAPRAVHAGVLIAGDDLAACDAVAATMMGFRWQALPIVARSLNCPPDVVVLNGKPVPLARLRERSVNFAPPTGWNDPALFLPAEKE
jgi:hypothetical protein